MIKALPTTPTVAKIRSWAVGASVSPGAADRIPSTQRTMASHILHRLSIHSPATATSRQEASPTGTEKRRRPGRKAIAVTVEGCPETAEGEWKLFDGLREVDSAGWNEPRKRRRRDGSAREDRAPNRRRTDEPHRGELETSVEHHRDVRIIAVPYDSGHPGLRMGAGPEHLLHNGFGEAVRPEGRRSSVTNVRHVIEPTAEVATAFELHALVSGQVRHTIAEGGFPLVLSGNCNTAAIGAIAGAGPEGLGIVWFDAHGEFNTPETTTTGFIDGMGLAIAVGRCWKAMAKGVPGFAPVPEANMVMAWVRQLDGAELERLDASEVAVVGAHLIEKQGFRALGTVLDDLSTRVGRVYVHVDLDVLDAEKVGKANEFAAEGGPNAEELQSALGMVRERFEVAAAGMASYDPALDADGRVLRAAIASASALTNPTSPPG
jgi:arginase